MLRPISSSSVVSLLNRLKCGGKGSSVHSKRFASKNGLTRQTRAVSTEGSRVQNKSQPVAEQEDDLVQKRREERRQAASRVEDDAKEYKTSFGKDIFLGNFDTGLLNFPEVLEKEQHETLHQMLEPIDRFFEEKGNF